MTPQSRPHPLARPLTPAEAASSRASHGSNTLSVKGKKSFFRRFLGNLNDPVIRILLGALGLNLLFSLTGEGVDWAETGGIALAVLLATLISTLSEQGSEAAFSRLSEACGQATCKARRRSEETDPTGSITEIPLSEAAVGDVLLLSAGEMIPADGVLLSGSLLVDQSPMTGESREVEKCPLPHRDSPSADLPPSDPHTLLRGCLIRSGGGEMLVTRVGDATALGRISEEVQEDTRESPLKRRLAKLAGQISRMGYVAAGLVGLVFLLSVFLLDSGFDGGIILQKLSDWRYVWAQCFHALTLGLTVLVVAVPEGLPMMIAVVLSSNIRKMAKDQVLVRKPVGIEAAGSMDLLFTDKTGTLTEGILSVGKIIAGDGTAYRDIRDLKKAAPALFGLFSEACVVNTSSVGEDGSPQALGGNATDRALLTAVLPFTPKSRSEVLFFLPFDSDKKTSCALVRRNGREVLYVKGAPERLMGRLTDAYLPDGTRGSLDRAALEKRISAMTEKGGRVILCAEAVAGRAAIPTKARLEGGDYGALTLVCLLLLTDRVRREAPDSVKKLRRAGVHVVMMTGDNRDTARSIAESCGILGRGVDGVVDHTELAAMSDGEVKALLPRLGVVARALPADKSRLVRLAQEEGLVVGMTGDGINDAPALKRADVGFAMGSGTQVAKDAGDIIILDNNLSSIVRAVLYGRTVFKSIRKFITLQLTMNLCAVGVTMICPFFGVDAPVTVVQMLWINLIMDTLGGLAFAGEAPLPSYMEEAPKGRDEPILGRYMISEILWLGGFTVALCLFFLKCPLITGQFRPAKDDIYLLTAFFALFIFSSVFNCFNARTDRLNLFAGLHRNKGFCLIMAAVLGVQILFVYVGGAVLRTAPLTAKELGVTFLLALTVFPADLVRKVWRRLSGKGEGY